MMIHELKIKPEFFRKVRLGIKTSEIRLDDRVFMIGDRLTLKEWLPRKKQFTGREVERIVTDITRLYQVIPGDFDARWCVLHMKEMHRGQVTPRAKE